MKFKYRLMVGFVLLIFLSCSVSQKNRRSGVINATAADKIDNNKKTKEDSSKPSVLKSYKEVISANAITGKGLFTVHKINERYFFEIPNEIFDKDILLVSRIEQGTAALEKEGFGYAGDEIGGSQIQFSKGSGNKVYIRLMFYNDRSEDSSANGMYRSVKASNLQPIQAAFDIKAYQPDSTAVVIDVTDFLNSDNPLLYFDANGKKGLGLGGFQKDKSYISNVKSFPLNLELHSIATYLRNDLPVTYALNVSFVLLPAKPMQPRYFDNRVGYFKTRFLDYDCPQGVERRDIIYRWRLEPKDEDKEEYLRGELVEPKRPIVYYIDPATPKKWVPYLIQGVNDWQKAFEKAGFKHAIYALEAPANDSSFSLFDARHSAIIYKASQVPNARGLQISDPRTGEVLETHIDWYHNILTLLHDWYMIQAGPNDTGAQKMVFDDDLMGQLIRFVCSHEVGHTLGLRHNWGASSTVPTDSLRSRTYLNKNGYCPSIMDYARFNYVGQPEDHLSRTELLPRIGVYDEWAIEWGYRWLPQLKTREQEAAYMNEWIVASLNNEKRIWWGQGESGILTPWGGVRDPRRQPEDLGDNAMKAGYYGIQNLKRVMSNLTKWAVEPNQDYTGLTRMYNQVISQYTYYMIHVANNIGNYYWTEKYAGQPGPVMKFIPREIQKNAIQFLGKELFDTPEWLYNKEIFSLASGLQGEYIIRLPQKAVLDWLVSFDNYMTTSWGQSQQPGDVYTFDEFLTDLESEIWKELNHAKPISLSRRNLQKLYTERLIEKGIPTENYVLQLDFYPLLNKHIHELVQKISQALPRYTDEMSQWHLRDVRNRLEQVLNFARFPQVNGLNISDKQHGNAFESDWNDKSEGFIPITGSIKYTNVPIKEIAYPSSCWQSCMYDLINKK